MTTKSNPDLRYDPPEIGGGLDELVAHNASVHLERLDRGAWMLIVEVPRGKPKRVRNGAGRLVLVQPTERVHLVLHAKRPATTEVKALVYERCEGRPMRRER